ncbi:MAG: hypothetical protein IKI37_00200, partial [Oscillospiraceae bacterium]|nr:hypothetical protein [Oscillospiraceae bacterium]
MMLKKYVIFGTIALLLTAGTGCLVQYVPVLTEAAYEKFHSELKQAEQEMPLDLENPDNYLSQGFG